MKRATYRLIRAACSLALFAGCTQSMVHQSKLRTDEATDLWVDGTSSRPFPEGVVAQSDLALDHDAATPPHLTATFMQRGQERYRIYCTPCHGLTGDGNGMIVQRGFPAPPSYQAARLRQAPARYLFDVISQGHGVMYSYASQVTPRDRWAIVAYIRALQTSRSVALSEVPDVRAKLPP